MYLHNQAENWYIEINIEIGIAKTMNGYILSKFWRAK